jgi:hypothetical protein
MTASDTTVLCSRCGKRHMIEGALPRYFRCGNGRYLVLRSAAGPVVSSDPCRERDRQLRSRFAHRLGARG